MKTKWEVYPTGLKRVCPESGKLFKVQSILVTLNFFYPFPPFDLGPCECTSTVVSIPPEGNASRVKGGKNSESSQEGGNLRIPHKVVWMTSGKKFRRWWGISYTSIVRSW